MTRVDVRVIEHHDRRFAAEFERHLLQIAGGRLDDQLADFRGAGEGDLVDMRMRRKRSARGLAIAGEDVDDAVGNAGFGDEFAEP